MKYHALAVFALFLLANNGRAQDDEEYEQMQVGQDDVDQTMEFSTPDMTDEEQFSDHMPLNMLCDGCLLIVNRFSNEFEKATAKYARKGGYLSESQAIDVVETVCEASYEEYGAKEINGKLRLSGPGTEIDGLPGVMQGGGKWPRRKDENYWLHVIYSIREVCSRYWDELGDEGLYLSWLDGSMKDFMCWAPAYKRGYCFIAEQAKKDKEDMKDFIESEQEKDAERKERLEELYKVVSASRRKNRVKQFDEL